MNDTKHICKICNKKYKNLSLHVKGAHKIEPKIYYDKWIRKDGEGICYCNKETNFVGISNGYCKFCGSSCLTSSPETQKQYKLTCLKKYNKESASSTPETQMKIKNSFLKKYGVDSPLKNKEIMDKKNETIKNRYGSLKNKLISDKKKTTSLKNYGVDCPLKSELVKNKIKNTCKFKYNVEYIGQYEPANKKRKETLIKNYGVDSALKSEIIKEKRRINCLLKYGVTSPSKLQSVIEKNKKTCMDRYGYESWVQTPAGRENSRNTCISYVEQQKLNGESLCPCISTNERICLNELQNYTKFEIQRNPRIIGYFPDGYIKELNLIIEFDEAGHYINNQLSLKDINRENDFKQKLNCNIFRIKEQEWIGNKQIIIDNFINIIKGN
jgi:very-short-patch-repair endonuclease